MFAKSNRLIWGAACAGMCVAILTGCAQTDTNGSILPPPPDTGARLAEAIELTAKGETAHSAGDLDTAMGFYREATQITADAPAIAWNNLGTIHLERGEYYEATQYLLTASQLAPLDPQPMYNLGLAYFQSGWDRDALDAFIKALDREPNYIAAIRGAAKATIRLRLTDEDALKRLDHALLVESDPTWREVFQREHLAMKARLESNR